MKPIAIRPSAPAEADQQLDALLDALPRVGVPESFALDVLTRIDTQRRRTSRWRALAAAAVVAALGSSTWFAHSHRSEQARNAHEIAMRQELRSLGAELRQLERQRDQAQPVVFLGTTDDVDIVVDLRRLAQYRLAQQRQSRPGGLPGIHARPAALRPNTSNNHNNTRVNNTSGGIYP